MSESPETEAIRRLRELGLNQLEAEVYTFLLANPGVTAYRVGKRLGRPTANVYSAVESLARRGAVLVEEGSNRLCRAVPVEQFLGHLERGFLHATRVAGDVLSRLERVSFDERVYRVDSVPSVIERAVAMLERAEKVAVVDAFPRCLEAVRNAIEGAAARGVEVHVEAYAPIDLAGVELALVPRGQESLTVWRSEQLNLVVDGQELLVALLSSDLSRVFQAIWSRSLYLSCLLHGGQLGEQTVIRMLHALEADPSGATLPGLLRQHRFFRDSEVPGHRELVARFVRSPEEES